MASRSSIALKHWNRIIARWPVDKVRPEAVSFQKLMQQRVQKPLNSPASAAATGAKGNPTSVQPAALPIWNENQEMKNVNVLYALLEDRFAKEYPLPATLRHPASSPTHYDDIVQESEAAPSRGLFTKFTNKLKGMVRFS